MRHPFCLLAPVFVSTIIKASPVTFADIPQFLHSQIDQPVMHVMRPDADLRRQHTRADAPTEPETKVEDSIPSAELAAEEMTIDPASLSAKYSWVIDEISAASRSSEEANDLQFFALQLRKRRLLSTTKDEWDVSHVDSFIATYDKLIAHLADLEKVATIVQALREIKHSKIPVTVKAGAGVGVTAGITCYKDFNVYAGVDVRQIEAFKSAPFVTFSCGSLGGGVGIRGGLVRRKWRQITDGTPRFNRTFKYDRARWKWTAALVGKTSAASDGENRQEYQKEGGYLLGLGVGGPDKALPPWRTNELPIPVWWSTKWLSARWWWYKNLRKLETKIADELCSLEFAKADEDQVIYREQVDGLVKTFPFVITPSALSEYHALKNIRNLYLRPAK